MALEMQKIVLEDSARLKKEKKKCDDTTNPNKKCMVSNWGPFTSCSATCGKGVRFRFRNFTHLELNAF